MPDPTPPQVTLLPAPTAKPAVNLARTVRVRSPPRKAGTRAAAKPKAAPKTSAKPTNAAKVGKAAKLALLAQRLESGWEAALAAHQARVRHDFATLHRGVARAKPADAAKLRRILDRKPKASGRLKDVRRSERALKDALERLKA